MFGVSSLPEGTRSDDELLPTRVTSKRVFAVITATDHAVVPLFS